MGPDNRQKICPACRTVQPIQAAACQCGHQFRTQFTPLDQTQVLTVQTYAQLPYQLIAGPRDLTEWRLGGAFAWAMATISTLCTYMAFKLYPLNSPAGFVATVVYVAIMATLCLKLRRYYVYPPNGVYPQFWKTFIPLLFVVGGLIIADTVRNANKNHEEILRQERFLRGY